jgi:hypothetical protein
MAHQASLWASRPLVLERGREREELGLFLCSTPLCDTVFPTLVLIFSTDCYFSEQSL